MSGPASPPTRRHLVHAWLLLGILSLATMIAGKTLRPSDRLETLGLFWAPVLLLVTGLKARTILWRYLGLERATPGWKGLFVAYLLIVLGLVLGAYVAELLRR